MRLLHLISILALASLTLACDDPRPAYPIESAAGAGGFGTTTGGGAGAGATPTGGAGGTAAGTAGAAGANADAGAGGG